MSEIFVRLEVGWLDSPKLIRAGIVGRGIHAVAMCLAKRGDDDGWFDRLLMIREGVTEEQIADAVGHELLEVDGDMVRPWDWLDRNPSQAAIDASRSARKRGGAIGNHRRWSHPGPFGSCPKCHPDLKDSQVVARSDRLPIASDRLPSPEKEKEKEGEIELPPDSQSDPPPEPAEPSSPVVDDQQIRRTAVLVGQALAAGAADPGAYAATVTKRILLGDDPTDRDEIHRALTDGQSPEAIAEAWDPGPTSDPFGIAAPRQPRQPSAAEIEAIRQRAHARIADDRARVDETMTTERAPAAAVAEIIGATRAKRRGGAV